MITVFIIFLLFAFGVSAIITALLHDVEPFFVMGAVCLVISAVVSLVGTVNTKITNIKDFRVEKTEYRVIVSVNGVEKTYKDIEIYKKIDKLESVDLVEDYNFWRFKNKESISLNFKN